MERAEARKAFVDANSTPSVTDCGWIVLVGTTVISSLLFQHY
jgi:hypothetical protein